jgi:hypothetical protein
MGASLRTEAELLGHEPGRPNVAPGGVRVHHPERYASAAALVDTCMVFSERPCCGGECDEGRPCRRHARTTQVSERNHRLRRRAFAYVVELCRAHLRAPAWSAEERRLEAEISKFDEFFVSVAYDRAMTLDLPGALWFGRRA